MGRGRKKDFTDSNSLEARDHESSSAVEGAFDDEIDRRSFVKSIGFGGAAASSTGISAAVSVKAGQPPQQSASSDWPVLRRYDQQHLHRIALPIGGIGTGTVSFEGRGDLRDWEIMNRPAKGFVPQTGRIGPFFVLYAEGKQFKSCRLLEGPLEFSEYEGSHGSEAPNENLPRFRNCSFETSYPFGRVHLSDPDIPLSIEIEAFNPFIPGDTDKSGIPAAVLSYRVMNQTQEVMTLSVCGNLPNFIGIDGWDTSRNRRGDRTPVGAKSNRNTFREEGRLKGIIMSSEGVDPGAGAWGTICLSTLTDGSCSHRTAWVNERLGEFMARLLG